MSAPTAPHDYVGDRPPSPKPVRTQPSSALKVLQALASLRLTVVLFSLAMVLVFFGTLGMMHESIEETMKRYFRSWVVMIDLRAFTDFGKVFLSFGDKAHLPGKIPFPGGYVIGWLMFINLLAAHVLRFKLTWKRSGIFMLHAGVIVLLAGEFLTGQFSVETRMMIKEGSYSDHVHSLHDTELVLTDPSNPSFDQIISVPGSFVADAKLGDWNSHDDVPVDYQVVDYFINSEIQDVSPGQQPRADKGIGKHITLERKRKVKGTDASGAINWPAAYVAFRDKQGNALGTYMLSTQWPKQQTLTIGETTYHVALRFKRTYKPFRVYADKTEHKVYAGTELAKDYASTVRVEDPVNGEYGPVRIWMNHPMYYQGETYYQSQLLTDQRTGTKTTGLQVVKNPAWTFPYLACCLVGLGMMFHFLLRLVTFLQNKSAFRAKNPQPVLTKRTTEATSYAAGGNMRLVERFFPLAIVVLAALMLLGRSMTPSPKDDRLDLYGFGKVPVQHGGRIQPIDSLAKNSLMVISSKQEVEEVVEENGKKRKVTHSATEWLLDVWTRPEKADNYRIFRVEHPALLNQLGLPERPGSYRYSWSEIEPNLSKVFGLAEKASNVEKDLQTPFDLKVMELGKHVRVYMDLESRKKPGLVPDEDAEKKWQSYDEAYRENLRRLITPEQGEAILDQVDERLGKVDPQSSSEVKRLVGEGLFPKMERRAAQKMRADVSNDPERFEKMLEQVGRDKLPEMMKVLQQRALFEVIREHFLKEAIDEAIAQTDSQLGTIHRQLAAYKANEPAKFNAALAEYHEKYTSNVSESDKSKVKVEAWMNYYDPFLLCMVLYVGVALLAPLSWLVWNDPLRKAAFWLACLTLAVHTGALLGRMYIGNRPPVTNLYSSAVFIGWGGLALSLCLERVYRLGIGSFAGAFLGFGTMIVARFLAESGDTLEMLEAVLDTNFWLATHVTCVTMGYVATGVAGVIGIVYIIGGVFTNGMRGKVGKEVSGMIYGTLCFATLLSFVGTVLGGIWADQSWGRFWGWDPKENGAVLIVIWNVLILHARWAGLAKARGVAVLSVIGNMWVAWSWFGTNQLGIGLHAYGFDNRLAMGCMVWWLSQGLIACLGMLPLKVWASFGQTAPARET